MVYFGSLWVVLGHFGSFCFALDRYELFWLFMGCFGSLWIVLARYGWFGSFWVVLADSIV